MNRKYLQIIYYSLLFIIWDKINNTFFYILYQLFFFTLQSKISYLKQNIII